LPVPTVTVKVRRVPDCTAAGRRAKSVPQEKSTDRSGWAEFDVADAQHYLIEVGKDSGFAAATQCVRLFNLGPPSDVAYVQIRLAPGRFTIVN